MITWREIHANRADSTPNKPDAQRLSCGVCCLAATPSLPMADSLRTTSLVRLS
jgi:hypothetical protein